MTSTSSPQASLEVTHVRFRYDEKKRVARLWVGGGADQTHKVVDVDRGRREMLVHEECEVVCTAHTYTHIHIYTHKTHNSTSEQAGERSSERTQTQDHAAERRQTPQCLEIENTQPRRMKPPTTDNACRRAPLLSPRNDF